MKNEIGKCDVCGTDFTRIHVHISSGKKVFICAECVEKAKDNFIWLCLSCGKTFIKPKELVITRIKDRELKKAYLLCKDTQVIQGIDMCISCTPELIVKYMEMQEVGMEC